MVGRYVAREGHQVIEAVDGTAGLAAWRASQPDLIVLEYGADDYVVKPFSPRELAQRVAGC